MRTIFTFVAKHPAIVTAIAGTLRSFQRYGGVQFAIYVAYANRLENAFLADEMASAQATLQHMDHIAPDLKLHDLAGEHACFQSLPARAWKPGSSVCHTPRASFMLHCC